MAMTIKVYEVDRYGQTKIIRPKTIVKGIPVAGPPQETSRYPACRCVRCTGGPQ